MIYRTNVLCVTIILLISSFSQAQIIEEFPVTKTNPLSHAGLSTSKAELPSSITVITRQDLKVLGISTVTDALRFVPGMSVTQSTTYSIKVGYHGTNSIIPRRMEVLIDGMSIRQASNSSVNWNLFPISIDDIERIEITRNPDQPRHGSYSFQATINFITRHPFDIQKNEVIAYQDTNNLSRQSVLAKAEFSQTQIYARAENIDNDGFDLLAVRQPDNQIVTSHPVDGQADKKVHVRSNTILTDRLQLDISASYQQGRIQRASSDIFATSLNDETFDNTYINNVISFNRTENDIWTFQANLTKIDFRKSWDTCYPTFLFTDELRAMHLANPQYASALIAGRMPTGGTELDNQLAMAVLAKFSSLGSLATQPQCGNINEDFVDLKRSFSIDNTHILNNKLKIISGVQYQPNYSSSQTFLNGKVHARTSSIYSSIQYDPNQYLTFNAGALHSKDDLTDISNTSPLAGLGFHYLSNHTAKLIYSKSYRNPNILETSTYWSYFMTGFSNPFDGKTSGDFYRVTTNRNQLPMVQEELESTELSFNGSFASNSVNYDIRVFSEDLEHLISQDINFANLNLTNEGATYMKGAEAELDYTFTPTLKLSIGGSRIFNDSSNVNDKSLHTPISGFLSLMYTGDISTASISYLSSKELQFSSFDRIEISIGQNYLFDNQGFSWSLKVLTQTSDYVATLGKISGSGTDRESAKALMSYDDDYAAALRLGIQF